MDELRQAIEAHPALKGRDWSHTTISSTGAALHCAKGGNFFITAGADGVVTVHTSTEYVNHVEIRPAKLGIGRTLAEAMEDLGNG